MVGGEGMMVGREPAGEVDVGREWDSRLAEELGC